MPIEPQPPPSPMGKNTSHTVKHICSPTSPCMILLYEVRKHYHAFPNGMFKTLFSPPAVPKTVLCHISSHPPTWSWTTKAGPKASMSFKIPTVPTSCGKGSHQAIQWIVSIFHTFKSQLAPSPLDIDTGRVLPAYVKLYQSNMLVHLHTQQAVQAKSPPTPHLQPTRPTQTPTQSFNAIIADLQAEISSLRSDLEASKCTCTASTRSSTPTKPSPSSPITCWSLTPTPPSPPPLEPMVPAHLPYSGPAWLEWILDNLHCPPHIQTLMLTTVPLLQHSLSDDVSQVLQVNYERAPSRYLGVAPDGNLYMTNAPSAQQASHMLEMPIIAHIPPHIWSTVENSVLRCWPLTPPSFFPHTSSSGFILCFVLGGSFTTFPGPCHPAMASMGCIVRSTYSHCTLVYILPHVSRMCHRVR